jgi:hypothetical protein
VVIRPAAIDRARDLKKGPPVIEPRIENDQVDLYDASSGMYRRTIRPGGMPTSVQVEGDEVAITLQSGTVDIYSSNGLYKRTMSRDQEDPRRSAH